MSAMQKRKGKAGELELANLLRDELGDQVTRNLRQSREGGADLEGTPWTLEVKRAATPRINEWWSQACSQAAASGGAPALAYRIDRKDWVFVLPLGAVLEGYDVADTRLTVSVGMEEFITITREAINR